MSRFVIIVLLVCLCQVFCFGEKVEIDNGVVRVCYDSSTGRFKAWAGGREFVSEGRLSQEKGKAAKSDISIGAGSGKVITVSYDNGSSDFILLYEDSPFVWFRSHIVNSTEKAVTIKRMVTVTAAVDFGKGVSEMKVLGSDGLTDGATVRTSFSFLSAADPVTRKGVVAGWATHNRGSGIVLSKVEKGKLVIDGRSEYGKLLVGPGESAKGEIFVIGYFEDVLDGLEGYADAAALVNGIELNPVTSGYCTWYSSPHGGASDEVHMAEMAEFCEKELTKFGFKVLQIDDKWQIAGRDFTTHRADGPYRSGMKKTAEKITGAGMVAGIWYIPFGWNPGREIFEEHQDWFVKDPAGEPYKVHWAGTCLDMTHPEAREFLREVVGRMSKEWGYKYIKVDGLWTGLAAKITYPSPVYKEDNLGDATFYDPGKTNLEAYRSGLSLVREAAGDDVFILGCNIAQNMRTLGGSFGRVDGMRVGRDIGAKWNKILPCVDMGTRLYFFHGRVWYNDPDCLMVREPMTLEQARAWGSWISISGQLNLVSEWLPGLPAERLDVVKRSMPNHGLCGRPIDLFSSERARVWQLTDTRTNQRRDVIGLFNWDDKEGQRVGVSLDELDLPKSATGKYVGFDYWSGEFVGPFSDKLEMDIEAGSCRIVAVRPALERPFLISTSRHICQGIVDVVEENWDSTRHTLSGVSKVVAGDPYEMRFATTVSDWNIESCGFDAEKDGQPVISAVEGGIKLVTKWKDSGTVNWRVRFRRRSVGLGR